MGNNPGQPDVSISVGGTLDPASIAKVKAEFKAAVDAMVKDIQDTLKSSQFSGGLEGIKGTFTADALGVDPKVLIAAFKQVEDGMKGVGTTAGDMSSKTTAALGNMGQLTDAYRSKVDSMKAEIRDYASQSRASYADIQKATASSLSPADRIAFNQAIKESSQKLKNASSATGELAGQQGKLQTSTFSLGDVFKVVFGVTIGQMAVQAVKSLIDQFKQAVQSGEDYLGTLFKMQVAVRALQRNGLDITLAEVNAEIDKLLIKFPIFSRQALTEGVTNALLFTNNLKLTKDQIDQMIQSSITLSLVMGKDVNEVMRTFALTMSSGYSEGLQRLGISINRVIIAQKAMELGFSGSYNKLTQTQIATAALALVVDQTNRMVEDAAKYQDTWTGKLKEGQTALQNFWTLGIGVSASPLWSSLVKGAGDIATWALGVFADLKKVNEDRLATILSVIATAKMISLLWRIGPPTTWNWDTFMATWRKAIEDARKEAQNIVNPTATQLGNAPVANLKDMYGLSDADQNIVDQAMTDLNTQLTNLEKQGIQQRQQLMTSKVRDWMKIDQDLYRNLQQAALDNQRTLEKDAIDHQRKLDDIATKTARSLTDAQTTLSRDLVNIEQDSQTQIADAKLKYQQDTIDREAAYQLKIKQMQERYLFDLDDAIRSRNAKQALQITRQLKFDYGQAQETQGSTVGLAQTDFERQMADIERQKQAKIQQRNQEFQQKRIDLALQATQEKADEAVRYQQQLVDEATQYALKQGDLTAKARQDRADRETQYKQQLDDLNASLADQYQAIAAGLMNQYKLTGVMLKAMYDSYLVYYGPSGALDGVYAYMVSSAQDTANKVAAALGSTMTGTYLPGNQGGGHAEGGSFIASRLMTTTLGERGPELVTVTPLSYVGKNVGKFLGTLPVGTGLGGQKNGQLGIQILLSSDLEARIISNSVDKMSDIMVSVERENR